MSESYVWKQEKFDFVKETAIVYVDVNNLYHRYKKIDFKLLRDYLEKEYSLLKVIAYTSVDLDNEAQRKFLIYLTNNNYTVQILETRNGTNIDNMLSSDLVDNANILPTDFVVIVSCDNGFSYPAKKAIGKGIRVHTIGSRGNTHLSLLSVSDKVWYLQDLEGVVIQEN